MGWSHPLLRITLAALLLACLPLAAENSGVAAFASQLEADGYQAVPMTRHGDAHLTVDVRLNDVPGTFILDTGAGRSVIDRAAQARFDRSGQAQAGGRATGAGGTDLALATLPGSRLRIGAYQDDAFTVHFLALDHVNTAFRQRGVGAVDGVIGADILKRGAAIIDYPGLRLYLRNPDAGSSAAASLDTTRNGHL